MQMLTCITRWIAAGLFAVILSSTAFAEWNAQDRAEFQRIISSQISAFRSDDGAKAFSFASPSIRKKFANSANFIGMVKTGYPAVYGPKSFTFGDLSKELGDPTQTVRLIGPGGNSWLALYGFQKQADGSWRISGVVVVKMPGAAA